MRRSILIPLVQIFIFVLFSDYFSSTNALSLKAGAQGPIDSDSDSDQEEKKTSAHPTLKQVSESLKRRRRRRRG
ncbi:Signal peptide region containing protein, partial [Cryptosporidium hominis]